MDHLKIRMSVFYSGNFLKQLMLCL